MTGRNPTRGPKIRLGVYDLPADGIVLSSESTAAYFLYVKAGAICAEEESGEMELSADEGCFVSGSVRPMVGTEAWLFEVALAGSDLPAADLVIAQTITPAFGAPYIVRGDRIESQAGAQTPRHGHRGPGLRRLVFGRLRAEVGESLSRIDAGAAWFESGQEPVVGTNVGDGNAAFVRLLLLPSELAGGKSSFVPANPTEAKKPRSVDNRLFDEVTWQMK